MIFHDQITSPANLVDGVGIAIRRYRNNQNHIAILFKELEDEDLVRIIHVGSYKGEFIGEVDKYYLWADLNWLHPIRKQALLASIQQIADVNRDTKLRYGFNHSVFCFDPNTGKLNANYDQSKGFTCSTFVLEVFLANGITLIDWETWPEADEADREFQNGILNYLLNQIGNITEEYLNAQRQQLGGPRFKPQEIAVASQTMHKTTWNEAQEPAGILNQQLTQRQAAS